jgi:diguanylate cyclase (GGDEF)-like protein
MPSEPVVHWSRYYLVAAAISLVVPLSLPLVRGLERTAPLSWASTGSDFAAAPLTYAWVLLGTLAMGVALASLFSRWNERSKFLSITDALTGLYNRRHFASSLDAAMSRDRRKGVATCVMCIDLDRLKVINDQFGHEQGDAALVKVASILSARLRARDLVARFGGDEFAVLLPETTTDVAIRIGERVLNELRDHPGDLPSALSVSIGIAELEGDATAAELMVAADRALYWVKSTGGGRVAIAPRAVIGFARAGRSA